MVEPVDFTVSLFLLAFFQGALEAIGLGSGFQDVGLVGQTIQNRFAQARIGEHLCPFRKRQVGGNKED